MSGTQMPQPPPTTQPGPPAPSPARGSNGLATAGFVLGLIGLLGAWVPFLNVVSIALGVIGAILALVGLFKSRKVRAGKGLAIAGLVLGVLAVIIAVNVNDAVVDAVDNATSTSVEAPDSSGDNDGSDDGAADSGAGTTRDDPAPIGSAITGGDWTVTINSVETADEDSFGRTPEAGNTLLVINVTATYDGDDEQGETPWAHVKFVTAEGASNRHHRRILRSRRPVRLAHDPVQRRLRHGQQDARGSGRQLGGRSPRRLA